ncbi:MAG: XRE family transcriptional regulator [Boseongicola sp. SB0677_bin_26]|nr:XRE family transcriptional regulator [Boseongicola sp. SB0665_bin_10]MYG28048.1 XRE family transcriptional regulator [Boseongicola sp. SB0677_bin_26]
MTRVTIDLNHPSTFPRGRIDPERVDATSEADIALEEREDEAMQDMARCIRVSPATIRNWEQGRRGPTGAARALLRVLDKAPETALRVLT